MDSMVMLYGTEMVNVSPEPMTVKFSFRLPDRGSLSESLSVWTVTVTTATLFPPSGSIMDANEPPTVTTPAMVAWPLDTDGTVMSRESDEVLVT